VVKGCYDYTPFGEELLPSVGTRAPCYSSGAYPAESDVQPLKFTGKERDAETGLDYFEARYMSSAQGRFTSPDSPLIDQHINDPQSWNLYTYVRNNPLRFMDPTGGNCIVVGKVEYDDDEPETQTCAEADPNNNHNPSITIGLSQDEAHLLMLQGVGEAFTVHGTASFVSEFGQSTASILAPLPTSIGQCITGHCSGADLVLGMVPGKLVKNQKLRNMLTMFNRTGTGIGTGSTADAIRHELKTGVAVGGKFHFTKGVEMRNGLKKLLDDSNLDPKDREVVKELLRDLQNALSGK